MPIYVYKCESCGYGKDVLQKMSDAPLSECPQCHLPTFKKQVTASGFQLKGAGWYETDFKGGAKPAAGSNAAPESACSASAPAASSCAACPASPPVTQTTV